MVSGTIESLNYVGNDGTCDHRCHGVVRWLLGCCQVVARVLSGGC